MENKPLLWVLGGGAFAFTAVVSYWIFAITLANQLKSDQISPQKTAEFIHAVLEANRNNYTDNVVVKLGRDGIEAHEHWRDERGVPSFQRASWRSRSPTWRHVWWPLWTPWS